MKIDFSLMNADLLSYIRGRYGNKSSQYLTAYKYYHGIELRSSKPKPVVKRKRPVDDQPVLMDFAKITNDIVNEVPKPQPGESPLAFAKRKRAWKERAQC